MKNFKILATFALIAFMMFAAVGMVNAYSPPTIYFHIQTSDDAYSSINPHGSVSVAQGTDKTFTISASSHYHILDVLIDGSSIGPVLSYTFTNVQSDHTISVTSTIDTFTITTSATPSEGGTITPTTVVNYDAEFTVEITANCGWYICNLTDNGNKVSIDSFLTYYAYEVHDCDGVRANHNIVAVFCDLHGPQGPTGPTGETGEDGQDGTDGQDGETGPEGPQGETGPQGPVGETGPQGEIGPVGPQGEQGPIGDTGPVGPVGPMGPQGPSGVDGVNGLDGKDGTNGVNGQDGKDGIDGNNGIDGVNGKDGSVWYNGNGTALSTLGVDGDYYIDVLTCNVYYKVSGVWVFLVCIKGDVGATGLQGLEGLQGPTGLTGPIGLTGAVGPMGLTGLGIRGSNGADYPLWVLIVLAIMTAIATILSTISYRKSKQKQ